MGFFHGGLLPRVYARRWQKMVQIFFYNRFQYMYEGKSMS